jgi:hypothetical protein
VTGTEAPTTEWSKGGCHCGLVRIEVRGEPKDVLQCNCSICTMKGYLHWIVPTSDFRVLSGEEALSTYQFNTKAAKHHFCSACGVSPFYVARSDPDKIDVNARCIEGVDLSSLELRAFDGANWEQAFATYRDDS